MSVFDRLEDGETIWSDDPESEEFMKALLRGEELMREYNTLPMTLEERRARLAEITGREVKGGTTVIAPFYFDLGFNIRLGEGVMLNYGCTLLDDATITIGDGTKVGPFVKMVTATHPTDPSMRSLDRMASGARRITIGKFVWIGTGAIILPGVTVGDYATVGAGSVVTHDVEPRTVVVGNPARVLRRERPRRRTTEDTPRLALTAASTEDGSAPSTTTVSLDWGSSTASLTTAWRTFTPAR